jgi:hypothetical protein
MIVLYCLLFQLVLVAMLESAVSSFAYEAKEEKKERRKAMACAEDCDQLLQGVNVPFSQTCACVRCANPSLLVCVRARACVVPTGG